MLRTTAVALLLGVVSSAYAGGLRFDPPAPDSRSFIQVTVGGMANGCIPHGGTVARSGSAITIRYPDPWPPNVACPAMILPWAETLPLGVLPPGVYQVTVTVDAHLPGMPDPFAQGTLEVRDADARFRLFPSGVPSTG